ncbi:3-methyl-2-oxobutanoate dehydrogenase (2-methylpropanoyl-transferring) subunit alpha [Litoreibacter sp.]|nr:3-methyl-2-oxobutanoate dehydrogenase (2-methylpropanoyl-transferring) subunit alpha [Litoreibacter sp.]
MTTPLTIRVPEPPARPKETPDFSYLGLKDAPNPPVPAVDVTAADISGSVHGLVRILDDHGVAHGPWADYLAHTGDEKALRQGLRDMLTMRAIDKRMQMAQRQGKTSFYLQCTGEEAIGCGFQRMLSKGDMNFPTYRQQSLLVAADYPLRDFLGQLYSNELDPMDGRQLPIMHSSKEYGFFSISGNLGTQFVQSVGWAMGSAMSGNDKIAAAWIGDGATASSDFHSGLLMAAVYRPPVVLNVVNNQWAISAHNSIATGGESSFAARAIGYGIPAIRVDGNDYLAVLAVSKWAIARARGNHGPCLIEWVTYRAAAHSTSDDPSAYRPKNEAEAWPLGDPVDRLKAHLIHNDLWSEERHTQHEVEIQVEVAACQKEVEAHGTLLDPVEMSPADIFRDLYADIPEHLRRQRQKMGR